MEFALSEDQTVLQGSVNGVLERSAPLDVVRQIADGDAAAKGTLDGELEALGLSLLAVPEAQGGLGLGLLDAVIVQELLGTHVSPAAFLARQVMAMSGLVAAGATEWLSQAVTGDVRFGVAIAEASGARADAGVTTTGDTISGRSLFAQDAQDATHILVADTKDNLQLVAADAPGLKVTALSTIDRTREFSLITYDTVPATQIGDRASLQAMLRVGRILLAADTLGAAQSMLDKAVAYASERKQFGRVIGSFQAVKHLCADMAAQLEPARALVWHAAHACDVEADEADLMVLLAKSHLSEVGTFVARTATEVHGGMGFTDLVGLHYWFKRIGANRQLLGGPERLRTIAASLQGWA